MTEHVKIEVEGGERVAFRNNADFCVGTGRMFLALHKEYQDQLKLVQDAIGFRHIRGHGLLCDDMAICNAYEDESGERRFEYNFSYVDRVFDCYLGLGLRPFIELGFMPQALASGDQTVFYWKGNVTPPKDYGKWADLVQALLRHLIDRYGRDEATAWPIEVRNEPNLSVCSKGADKAEYFKLYDLTARAVKAVDASFKVGGPAICGVDDKAWMKDFLDYVRAEASPLDFVTRHHYCSEPPSSEGRYSYIELVDLERSLAELEATRAIVDGYEEFRGMDIHVTEFNTSYLPDCPIHDTNLNAAYVAALLSRLGDAHASYSYWTFGDVFEEKGVPFTPFHGGFGLVANGCIPKPTFWTFAFYKKLVGDCVHRSAYAVIVKTLEGGYRGVLWNPDPHRSRRSIEAALSIKTGHGEYCLVTKTVDEECCNPLKLWHDLGEPPSLSAEQRSLLIEHSKPLVRSMTLTPRGSKIEFDQKLAPNAVAYFELSKVGRKSDRGFSYERLMRGEA